MIPVSLTRNEESKKAKTRFQWSDSARAVLESRKGVGGANNVQWVNTV